MIKNSVISILLLIFTVNNNNAQEPILYSSSTHNIPSDHVNSVFIDADNIKWFGTDNGLVSYDGIDWNSHSISSKINSIISDSSNQTNQFFLATESGALQIQVISSDSIEILNEYHTGNSDILSDKCISIQTDNGEVVWIGTDSGLSIIDGNSWINLTDQDWEVEHNFINQIKKRPEDGFNYLSTKGGGISRLKYNDIDGITGASAITTTWHGIPSDTVNAIYFDSEYTAWFGTTQGLGKHTGADFKENWFTFKSSTGLADDHVLSVAGDLHSNLWVGTANGLSRFSGTEWDTWSTSDQSAGDSVLSISQDNDGSMWICTNNGILNFTPLPSSLNQNTGNITAPDINLSVYPNPFNSNTTVYYEIFEQSNVKLTVFNTLGKLVATLVNGTKSPNNYRLQFNAGHLPSGIYYCRLNAGPKTVVKRLMHIK